MPRTPDAHRTPSAKNPPSIAEESQDTATQYLTGPSRLLPPSEVECDAESLSSSDDEVIGSTSNVNPFVVQDPRPRVQLFDVITMPVPPPPPMHSFSKDGQCSKATRGPTDDDFRLPRQKQLKSIVPFGPMLYQYFEKLEKLLEQYSFDADDTFLDNLLPSSRAAHLPAAVCSEHDTEDWGLGMHLRPILAILHYCTNIEEGAEYPNIFSCGGSAPVPDALLFGKHIRDILATIEFKTHAVLSSSLIAEFEALLEGWEGMPLGYVTKFHWPKDDDPELDKMTKVLTQIWTQMTAKNVKYGMLSSYDISYFFYRHDDTTMYISEGYTWAGAETTLATLVFVSLALGKLINKDDFIYPLPVHGWWNKELPREKAGVDERTLPKHYRNKRRVKNRDFDWVDEALKDR